MVANQDSGLHGERILTSALFDLAESDKQALEIAIELTSLLNGFIALFQSSFLYERTYKPEHLFSPDTRLGQPTYKLRSRHAPLKLGRAYKGNGILDIHDIHENDNLYLLEVSADPAPTPQIHMCLASNILALALQDEGVYLLLRLFAFEVNWVNLYRILESLKTLMMDDSFPSPIGSKSREAIKNSPNNFSITGLRARHGRKRAGKPNNSPRASLTEGFEVLQSATRTYLEFTLGQRRVPHA